MHYSITNNKANIPIIIYYFFSLDGKAAGWENTKSAGLGGVEDEGSFPFIESHYLNIFMNINI
jgi:hypothetical protein